MNTLASKLPSRSVLLIVAVLLGSGCSGGTDVPISASTGTDPVLPEPQTSLLPTVNVARAERWPDGSMPTAAAGLLVTEFAAGLSHPRWIHVLPNGDVLIAESNRPPKPEAGGIRSFIMGLAMKRAGAGVDSANRITLLRDTDNDGVAEIRRTFIKDLYSPFGMTLVGDTLFIANADGIVSLPYSDGALSAQAEPVSFFALPGGPLNHHWTKNIIASDDGKALYAAVGSNSNIAENGLDAELGRAAIWEIDIASATGDVYADGLRNPVGMDFHPSTDILYTVVNERDLLGDNLVPDYLTSVRRGDFFGWPYSYFGDVVDKRVKPFRPDLVKTATKPDYALGAHTASLGLDIVSGSGANMNSRYGEGAYIGQHGSWNRKPHSGYKVIFVPFRDGRPVGEPTDILTGFLVNDKARGRPVGVTIDHRGGLLVADDVGNRIWRVSAE